MYVHYVFASMFVFKPVSLLIPSNALSQPPPSLSLSLSLSPSILPSPESRWTEYIGLKQQQTLAAPNDNTVSRARSHASTAWLFTKPCTLRWREREGTERVNKGGVEGEREIMLSCPQPYPWARLLWPSAPHVSVRKWVPQTWAAAQRTVADAINALAASHPLLSHAG